MGTGVKKRTSGFIAGRSSYMHRKTLPTLDVPGAAGLDRRRAWRTLPEWGRTTPRFAMYLFRSGVEPSTAPNLRVPAAQVSLYLGLDHGQFLADPRSGQAPAPPLLACVSPRPVKANMHSE